MHVIRELWNIILTVGYIILILLAGFFLFTIPDQAKDFVYVMLQDHKSWFTYLPKVTVAVFLWSFITWYSACIMLQTDPMNFDLSKKYVQRIVVQAPRILGITPFLILLVTFSRTANLQNNSPQISAILFLILMAIALYFLYRQLDKRVDRNNIVKGNPDTQKAIWPTNDDLSKHYEYVVERSTKSPFKTYVPSLRKEWTFINKYSGMRFYFIWTGLFIIAFAILMCFNKVAAYISWYLKPATVLTLTLILYTFVFTVIYYFNDLKKRPILIGLLVWVLICSIFNDNTRPFYRESRIPTEQRLTTEQAFTQWLQVKWKDWMATNTTDSMPVFFIATQGGGIRGTHWTAGVFNHLDTLTKGKFYNQVFCISGVSGGGVGAAFYNAFIHDRHKGKAAAIASFEDFQRFIGNDFLSPVTASFAFSDNLQRLLPLPVKRLDRSKMLALTWEIEYKRRIKTNTLEAPFLDLWYGRDDFNTTIPSLLINGTLAENGQRVVTSNLKLSHPYFNDDVDFYDYTKRDISMSAAIMNCCRFPYLTSGGLLDKDGCPKGHIVDGGYRENTGLQSLANVYYSVLPIIMRPPDSTMKIKPIILYLKNGGEELDTTVKAVRFFHDALTPVRGIVSINGTGMPSKGIETMIKQAVDYGMPSIGTKYHQLWLANRSDSTIKFPLGWYISDTVIHAIEARVKEIKVKDSVFMRDMVPLLK